VVTGVAGVSDAGQTVPVRGGTRDPDATSPEDLGDEDPDEALR
jgi:hypothetical protein